MNYLEIEYNLLHIAKQYNINSELKHPFQGRNFITSNIVSRFKMKNRLQVELSWGYGMDKDVLYGVTVAGTADLSECFNDVESVKTYVEGLSRAEVRNAY